MSALIAAFSFALPAFGVLSQESVDPQWRTILSGAMTMAFGAGISTVAIGGGFIVPAFGYYPLFASAAGLLFAATLLFYFYFRRFQSPSEVIEQKSA